MTSYLEEARIADLGFRSIFRQTSQDDRDAISALWGVTDMATVGQGETADLTEVESWQKPIQLLS